MLKLVQKRLRCKVVKFWSSPLSPLCDIPVPLIYPVTGKQLLTSNFSKVRFFHFFKLSKNTKTHGFLLYWQHLFKNPSVKYQIMWLMEQLLLPVRKAEAGRSTLSVTELTAKWFGFQEGDSVPSVSLALSSHSFLSIRSLFMAFNVFFRYWDHLLFSPLFQFSHLKLVYYVDWRWSRVQQHTIAEGKANFFVLEQEGDML